MRPDRLALAALLCIGAAGVARAQDSAVARVTLDDRGLTFSSPLKSTELSLRFYLQPVIMLVAGEDGGGVESVGMQIRRARISLAGTALDPRFRFQLQFALSRQDVDIETLGVVNTLADAVVTWNWTPSFFTALGQTKVYGNRQSLTPVSEIEFTERSIVNATFALDRDVGIFAGYTRNVGKGPFQLRAAITSGDGRNGLIGDNGLAYTARADWRPLGEFRSGGAFSEADLQREPFARFAIGTSYTYNAGAQRVGGSTGPLLYAARDMQTLFIDAAYKRKGFALTAEYARRDADDPITTSGDAEPLTRAVFVGYGVTAQASYVTRGRFLPALRVSFVAPDESIYGAENARKRLQTSLELARFLRGHRIKWTFELGRDDARDPVNDARVTQLFARFGVLAGI